MASLNIQGAEQLTLSQLTPVLAVVLTHDLLLSKRGIALPAKHGLHTTISRHKARLTSELTKARLRRGQPTLEALRGHVNATSLAGGSDGSSHVHPRWIRVNTLLSDLDKELRTTFSEYTKVADLSRITDAQSTADMKKVIYVDKNLPNLIAVPGTQDLSSSTAYKQGRLIFQEKASCFPAHLLEASSIQRDIIDACAAPGNKTTHLAAIVNASGPQSSDQQSRKIFACEKDHARSETLAKMVKLAGAGNIVQVKAKQDFMKLDPNAPQFATVEALLLDPSCSGSGIVGRDEAKVTVHLPSRDGGKQAEATTGKKRKRGQQPSQVTKVQLDTTTEADQTAEEAAPATAGSEDESKLASRLASLSSFQLRLLEHAMAFPAARRITYSTCSLHKEENEDVVARALLSETAQERGWRVLRREEQVEGMRKWGLRGSREAVKEVMGDGDIEAVAEACIRCEKGGEGGTMGFFVVGFVRDDADEQNLGEVTTTGVVSNGHAESDGEEDEWEGFSDSEG